MQQSELPAVLPVQSTHAPARTTLYEPLPFLLVRAPLFPLDAYLALHSEQAADAQGLNPRNARVQAALAVGSLALLEELERQSESPREQSRRERKLLRYLIRMATRPTPYGLFGGVALAFWGEQTNLSLASPDRPCFIRPDMGWLMDIVWQLEALVEVRRHLHFVANSAVIIRRGRIFLLEQLPRGRSTSAESVSLKATRVALRALELARYPISYGDLVDELLTTVPGTPLAKIEALITTLWQHSLLFTDLRPPLTVPDPVRYVRNRLTGVPLLTPLLSQLDAYLEVLACRESDKATLNVASYRQLVDMARRLSLAVAALMDEHQQQRESDKQPALVVRHPQHVAERSSTLLQIDTCLPLISPQVAKCIGEEAAYAAELLLRLSSSPQGIPSLQTYRQRFLERYGQDREVPLLELFDPHFGLGIPTHDAQSPSPQEQGRREVFPERQQELLRLATIALHKKQLIVQLDENSLKRLQTASLASVPPSLDIYVSALASSSAALDRGDYLLMLGPNIGALAAGRNLGRFTPMLGEPAQEALRQVRQAEKEAVPAAIQAEIVYLPREARLANVTIRPNVRDYEIPYGVMPTGPEKEVIPLDELVVGVQNERLYVRWWPRNQEVLIRASHMLTTLRAPALIRFLSEVSQDQVTVMTAFNWGDCAPFPFLPRVQVGRVVLSPAQWRINRPFHPGALDLDSSAEQFRLSLRAWRENWGVTRYVYLSEGDNRLLLDLEQEAQAAELRTTLRQLKEGQQVLLEEGLPGPQHAWLPGPGGHYLSEFVVSLALHPKGAESTGAASPAPTQERASLTHPSPITSTSLRLRPPGSDWLFVKCYCAPSLQEEFIAGPLLTFAQHVQQEELASNWFFIRYSDPEPHVRLRFQGSADKLMNQLTPALCRWANSLIHDGPCTRYVIDMYEREIERYGGPRGIEAAEAVFCADSRFVAELLQLKRQRFLHLDITTLAVLGIDELLGAFGFSLPLRLQWCRESIHLQKELAASYRQKSRELRALLGNPSYLHTGESVKRVAALFARRRMLLDTIGQQFIETASQGMLTQPLSKIVGSFVHMHCNRLLGTDRSVEREVLELLMRTYISLEQAPLSLSDGDELKLGSLQK